MEQKERLSEIKKILADKKHLKTREIAKRFDVSFDTARRDVLRLTTTGQAMRTHGGIMSLNTNQVPSYLTRKHILSPIKLKMAQAGKNLLNPGRLYYFAPSTTIAQLCNQIHGLNAAIVTNSLDNAMNLSVEELPAVNILGGRVQATNRYISSPYSLEELDHYHFDTAFVGAAKVDENGFYIANQADAAITRRAIELSDRVVLFAEKYKFTNTNSSPFKVESLNQVDTIISDVPLIPRWKSWFKPNIRIIHVMEESK
ncbi:DeoR/GlpR family DNA-binding transcription regulator [Lactobacillus colini]|nr:DeoR/GlpR family DNA-binding transcription regulator [Lactobacillus colini]